MKWCRKGASLGFAIGIGIFLVVFLTGCEDGLNKLTTTSRGSSSLQITGLIHATEIDVASKVGSGTTVRLYKQLESGRPAAKEA